MSTKGRLKELKKKNADSKKTLCCIGAKNEPKSEKRYEEYLKVNIQRPFIWLDV